MLCTCNEGHHFYLNDMQTNYVMEYLNDYNGNAKLIKIKKKSMCMFISFIFMKMWTQMWITRFSDIHYNMHMC